MTTELLTKYRVLDIGGDIGAYCGKLLGDLGAEVIKIEKPQGDPARNTPPFYHDIPSPERSLSWYYSNLHKKGITLDIETETGKQLFKELIKRSDVLIESFQPGYLDNLGLAYAALTEINRGIIVTSITPFGQKGPYSHYKVSDIVMMALGGMLRLHTDIGRPPTRFSVPLASFFAGLHAVNGTILALYYREMSGEGQHVDVSCQQAITLSLMDAAEHWDLNKVIRTIEGPYSIGMRPKLGKLRVRRVWKCKDGYVLFMMGGGQRGVITSSNALKDFANRCGMALNIKDYDFAKWDASSISTEEVDRIVSALADFIETKTKAELFEEAVAKSIHLFPLNTMEDVTQDSHFKERDLWVNVEHPELGKSITYPGFPQKMSNTEYQVQRRAPLLGEHNEEIYQDLLGMSTEEMILLKSQQII